MSPDRHSIISIGAVDFAAPARQFYRECRPWDGAQFDTESMAVNGFTPEEVLDASRPTLEKVIGEFLAWAGDAADRTLAGMNTFFDRDFLRTSCERYNMAWNFGHRILDLHSVCWTHMLKSGRAPVLKYGRIALSNDVILQYTGLPPEPRPHNGLVGAKMEAEAFSRLVHGRALLEEYSVHPLPDGFDGRSDGQAQLF